MVIIMQNSLKDETSPYLLQHANNPVNWYPWGEAAFAKALAEDKPIFLSIGYSTCHWCHVMAHECFEDAEVAAILNDNFVAIKVDKEERPDLDSVYMTVCQGFTGRGGWPTSIFMTPKQKPFYAGTYFPKNSRGGMVGFMQLLEILKDKWATDKAELIESADEIIEQLKVADAISAKSEANISDGIIEAGITYFNKSYDSAYGGFGNAPKFPSPHNLMFLMDYYETNGDEKALEMAEKTLFQMFKGGIYDHIGFGFSRYSTDKYFLVPHFEKMLYDNALLIMCYTRAFETTGKPLFKSVAMDTAKYVLREMTDPCGGFYSAQDADSDGVEGKYYVFDYDEVIDILGSDDGKGFNEFYGIKEQGNFEGKNIPNLLDNDNIDNSQREHLEKMYQYRKSRVKLHLDDQILTSWNALMISAFAMMYRVFGDESYLKVGKNACKFIDENLSHNGELFVSYRGGVKASKGFLDDYAFYIFASIKMYEATLNQEYLEKAVSLSNKAIDNFYDRQNGGFYLYGTENEQLVLRPKECFDGAMPSGNSVMAMNLVKLSLITGSEDFEKAAKQQLEFMSGVAKDAPAGYSFYLLALSTYLHHNNRVVCVVKEKSDIKKLRSKTKANIQILEEPTNEYKLLNNKTTFYICKNHSCLPPTNDMGAL